MRGFRKGVVGICERQRVDQNSKKRRGYERERVDFETCFRVLIHSLTLVATRTRPLVDARSHQRPTWTAISPSSAFPALFLLCAAKENRWLCLSHAAHASAK